MKKSLSLFLVLIVCFSFSITASGAQIKKSSPKPISIGKTLYVKIESNFYHNFGCTEGANVLVSIYDYKTNKKLASQWTNSNTFQEFYHILKFQLKNDIKVGDKFKISVEQIKNKGIFSDYYKLNYGNEKEVKTNIGKQAIVSVEKKPSYLSQSAYSGTKVAPFLIVLYNKKYPLNNELYIKVLDEKSKPVKNVKFKMNVVNINDTNKEYENIVTDSEGIAKLPISYSEAYRILIKEAQDKFYEGIDREKMKDEPVYFISEITFTCDSGYVFTRGDEYSDHCNIEFHNMQTNLEPIIYITVKKK